MHLAQCQYLVFKPFSWPRRFMHESMWYGWNTDFIYFCKESILQASGSDKQNACWCINAHDLFMLETWELHSVWLCMIPIICIQFYLIRIGWCIYRSDILTCQIRFLSLLIYETFHRNKIFTLLKHAQVIFQFGKLQRFLY